MLMAKTEVNGGKDEVWEFCKAAIPGQVGWNFGCWFVIDQEGQVVARFGSRDLAKCDAALATLASGAKL